MAQKKAQCAHGAVIQTYFLSWQKFHMKISNQSQLVLFIKIVANHKEIQSCLGAAITRWWWRVRIKINYNHMSLLFWTYIQHNLRNFINKLIPSYFLTFGTYLFFTQTLVFSTQMQGKENIIEIQTFLMRLLWLIKVYWSRRRDRLHAFLYFF